jgi:hypothetical protein
LGLKSEDEIDWDELASGVWSGVRGDGLQKAFNRMKKAVPDVESLAFNGAYRVGFMVAVLTS